jgi:hypothetical protein
VRRTSSPWRFARHHRDALWGVGVSDDPFVTASQICYAHWTADHDPAFRQVRPEEVNSASLPRRDHAEIAVVAHHRYLVAREYSAAGYCDLLSTFSDVLVLARVRELVSSRASRTD